MHTFDESQQSILKLLAEDSYIRFLQTNSNSTDERKIRASESYMTFQNYLNKRRNSTGDIDDDQVLTYKSEHRSRSSSLDTTNNCDNRIEGIQVKMKTNDVTLQTKVNHHMTVRQFINRQLVRLDCNENTIYGLYAPNTKSWLDEEKSLIEYKDLLDDANVVLELREKS